MNINMYSVSKAAGLSFLVIGISMLPSLAIAGIYNEVPAFWAFLKTFLAAVTIGLPLYLIGRVDTSDWKIRDSFLILTLYWIIAVITGAMPFVLSGCIPNFTDAFFESCSGFTTTGSTILNNIEALPQSMLFWRSFTHWIGGISILIFAIALMPSLSISGQNVAVSESLDKVNTTISDIVKKLVFVYILFTIVETILLMLGGLSLYDALIHTFGTLSTGGFSNYNESIAHFDSIYVQAILLIFMILSGVNFSLYFLSIRRKMNCFFRDAEFRFFILIIGVFTVLMGVDLFFTGTYDTFGEALSHSLFQAASILTTTGYASDNFALWPTFCLLLLMMLMFIGGCVSSTSGGFKVVRMLLLIKLIAKGIATRLHPNAVVDLRLNDRRVPSEAVTAVTNHAFLYISLIFIGTLLISLDGFDLMTSFSSVISCIGNIGPGFNLAGPMETLSFYSAPSKWLLSFMMLAGRLELYTLFIVLTPKFWRPDR